VANNDDVNEGQVTRKQSQTGHREDVEGQTRQRK